MGKFNLFSEVVFHLQLFLENTTNIRRKEALKYELMNQRQINVMSRCRLRRRQQECLGLVKGWCGCREAGWEIKPWEREACCRLEQIWVSRCRNPSNYPTHSSEINLLDYNLLPADPSNAQKTSLDRRKAVNLRLIRRKTTRESNKNVKLFCLYRKIKRQEAERREKRFSWSDCFASSFCWRKFDAQFLGFEQQRW